MIKILTNKIAQFHLIDKTINSQKPDISSDLLEAKAKCLTEIRFLALKVQQGKYTKLSDSFNENKREIIQEFKKDLSNKALHKMDFTQITQHPDTVTWLRLVKETSEDRLLPTACIEDHMDSTHEQWNIGLYHGEPAYHEIKRYFLNYIDAENFHYVVKTIVETLGG